MFEKYYIYKRDEYFDNIAYDDFLDAVDVAMENNCDEIEVHQWECEEDYKNYEPAAEQLRVWTKSEGYQ